MQKLERGRVWDGLGSDATAGASCYGPPCIDRKMIANNHSLLFIREGGRHWQR